MLHFFVLFFLLTPSPSPVFEYFNCVRIVYIFSFFRHRFSYICLQCNLTFSNNAAVTKIFDFRIVTKHGTELFFFCFFSSLSNGTISFLLSRKNIVFFLFTQNAKELVKNVFSDVFSRFIKRNSFLFRLILAPKKDYFNAPSLILFLFALNVVQHVCVCFLHFHVSLFIVCLSVCFYTVYFSSSDICFSVMYFLFAAFLLFCLLCTIVFLFHLFSSLQLY